MTFIVEKIPAEILASPSYALVGFNTDLSKRWAIDKSKEAFIVLNLKEGGAYEGTQETKTYTLCWKDELIRIVADPLPKTYTEQGATMYWRVHKLTIPTALQPQREEVLVLIKEAFAAVGDGCFNGHRFIAINIEFKLPSPN